MIEEVATKLKKCWQGINIELKTNAIFLTTAHQYIVKSTVHRENAVGYRQQQNKRLSMAEYVPHITVDAHFDRFN